MTVHFIGSFCRLSYLRSVWPNATVSIWCFAGTGKEMAILGLSSPHGARQCRSFRDLPLSSWACFRWSWGYERDRPDERNALHESSGRSPWYIYSPQCREKTTLCKKGSGAALSWTADITTSILLPLHSELWSRYHLKQMFKEKKMFYRNGGGDLRYARWDIFKDSSKFMMIHTEVQV